MKLKTLSIALLCSACLLSCTKASSQDDRSINNELIPLGTEIINKQLDVITEAALTSSFSTIQKTITSTVADNERVVRGIFMDGGRRAWAYATPDNPEGMPSDFSPLSSDLDLWADSLVGDTVKSRRFTSKELEPTGAELIECSRSILDEDGNKLGTLRYGLTSREFPKE